MKCRSMKKIAKKNTKNLFSFWNHKTLKSKCSLLLVYLFLLAFAISIEGVIIIDGKIIGSLTLLGIAICDFKYNHINIISRKMLSSHFVFATFALSMIISIDTQDRISIMALKISLIITNILYFNMIYMQNQYIEKITKEKKERKLRKNKIESSIVIEKIGKSTKPTVTVNSEIYEKFFYPD